MPDAAEGVGPDGPARTDANGAATGRWWAANAATAHAVAALARDREELSRLLARYAAGLRAVDAAETRRAAPAEMDLVTREALEAAAECGAVLQRLSGTPVSGGVGACAKAEMLCTALAEVDWDEAAVLALARSLREDLARIRSSGRRPPSGAVRWWSGFRLGLWERGGTR